MIQIKRIPFFPFLACALWAGLLYVGCNGLMRIWARHVPGYPNFAQFLFYAAVPATVALLNAWACVLIVLGRPTTFTAVAPVVATTALLPYIFMFTGGM